MFSDLKRWYSCLLTYIAEHPDGVLEKKLLFSNRLSLTEKIPVTALNTVPHVRQMAPSSVKLSGNKITLSDLSWNNLSEIFPFCSITSKNVQPWNLLFFFTNSTTLLDTSKAPCERFMISNPLGVYLSLGSPFLSRKASFTCTSSFCTRKCECTAPQVLQGVIGESASDSFMKNSSAYPSPIICMKS